MSSWYLEGDYEPGPIICYQTSSFRTSSPVFCHIVLWDVREGEKVIHLQSQHDRDGRITFASILVAWLVSLPRHLVTASLFVSICPACRITSSGSIWSQTLTLLRSCFKASVSCVSRASSRTVTALQAAASFLRTVHLWHDLHMFSSIDATSRPSLEAHQILQNDLRLLWLQHEVGVSG